MKGELIFKWSAELYEDLKWFAKDRLKPNENLFENYDVKELTEDSIGGSKEEDKIYIKFETVDENDENEDEFYDYIDYIGSKFIEEIQPEFDVKISR